MTTYTRKPLFRRGACSFWRGIIFRGSGSDESSETPDPGVPLTAILTEDGDPIFTEFSEFILTES